jgi:hypothetical protein
MEKDFSLPVATIDRRLLGERFIGARTPLERFMNR